MLTEKYAEQNSIALKIAGTVTSYRITLLEQWTTFSIHLSLVCMRCHARSYLRSNWMRSGEVRSLRLKV